MAPIKITLAGDKGDRVECIWEMIASTYVSYAMLESIELNLDNALDTMASKCDNNVISLDGFKSMYICMVRVIVCRSWLSTQWNWGFYYKIYVQFYLVVF